MKINALKNEEHLTLILGTKHYQFTGEKADSVFDLAVNYKKDPTEENLNNLLDEIAKINRIVHHEIIEEDGNGKYYLKGYSNVEMPAGLAETILHYLDNVYPTEALVNFWKLCMANPNKDARDGFFEYIKRFGITITDKGYAILYKSVAKKQEANDDLINFVSQQYTKIKRWKKSPKNYQVVLCGESNDEEGNINKEYCLEDYYKGDKKHEGFVGVLQDLHDDLDDLIEETDSYFIPHHKGGDYGNKIQLGKPVTMPRDKCDPDINKDCSYGLHVGARQYVRTFGFGSRVFLAVLINPMNIVALPKYDYSKIRVCEYYPYAIMAQDDEYWEEIEGGYFEEDYCNYEEEHIDDLLNRLSSTEQNLSSDQVEDYQNRLIDIYESDAEEN